MTKNDREALQLAMKLIGKDRDRAEQIAAKLADEPWWDVAEFAAYCLQRENLRLKSWEQPPLCVDDPDDCDELPDAARLARRMIAAGVSLHHPDPIAACEAAERQKPE